MLHHISLNEPKKEPLLFLKIIMRTIGCSGPCVGQRCSLGRIASCNRVFVVGNIGKVTPRLVYFRVHELIVATRLFNYDEPKHSGHQILR